MTTNINFIVFEGEEGVDFPVDFSLLNNLTEEHRQLVLEMQNSGHYRGGIYLPKFLREDLTINLEKLELAVTLAVIALEANSENDITLSIKGLEEYYIARNIKGQADREREERIFVLGFVTSVAGEASKNDTLEVKYVL